MQKKAVIISASSDIGRALATHWSSLGWSVYGTYRTRGKEDDALFSRGHLTFCDILKKDSIRSAAEVLIEQVGAWDVLVFAAASLDPIGPFLETEFDAWEKSVELNFLRQMELLHFLLPYRNLRAELSPTVIFFAGGGTNGAVVNYTSYAISKLALTKMCEFLDAEIPDTRFAIIGPGWVKTKIHEATLSAGFAKAGVAYNKTVEKESWVPMSEVVACCSWVAQSSSPGLGGRNFSVADDAFGTEALERALEKDKDMYKLRRGKNSWKP